MAGKNSRSSKTAHVLNLLSGGTPEVKPDAVPPPREAPPPAPLEPAPPASDMSVPEAPSSAARRLSPPILEVARSNNAALSESIHTALESAAGLLGADCRPLSGPSCISRFRSGGRGFSPGFGHSAPHSFCSRSLSFRAGAGIHRAVRRRRALQCDAALGGGKAGTLCKAVWPLQLSPLSGGRRGTGSHPAPGPICRVSARSAPHQAQCVPGPV